MKDFRKHIKRILAIDPSTRGFGFAVLEGSDRLIDWGVKDVHGHKNSKALRLIKKLSEHYEPDLVMVEDCDARGSRRRRRTKYLIRSVLNLCFKMRVRTRAVPRLRIRKVFGDSTKDQIAATIVERFPELAPWQPRPRKALTDFTEDYRMSIFDSVALAHTCFGSAINERGPHK